MLQFSPMVLFLLLTLSNPCNSEITQKKCSKTPQILDTYLSLIFSQNSDDNFKCKGKLVILIIQMCAVLHHRVTHCFWFKPTCILKELAILG